jgi:Protein of unknown function (DUF1194)
MITALSSLVVGTLGIAAWISGIATAANILRLADNSPNAVPVDTELVIAVDVSYSMDPEEQALQREGYITGLTSQEFMQALRQGMHGKVAVTYFEWAGPNDQAKGAALCCGKANRRRQQVLVTLQYRTSRPARAEAASRN